MGLFKASSRVLGLACSVLLAIGCSSQENPPPNEDPGQMPAISQSSGAAADAGGTSIAIIPPAADCALTSHTLTQITLTDANANGDVCLFAIGATPPDPNNVRVLTEDDRVVPISDTDGWQYLSGYETIQFVGGYCDLVLQGTLVNPRMLFGCSSHFIP